MVNINIIAPLGTFPWELGPCHVTQPSRYQLNSSLERDFCTIVAGQCVHARARAHVCAYVCACVRACVRARARVPTQP